MKPISIKMFFLKVVWKLTPDCKTMARLASQRLEAELPLLKWVQIHLHFLICDCCVRYFKQLELLHGALVHADDHLDPVPVKGLSPEASERIKVRLNAAETP